MRYNVAQLLKETTGATREYELREGANLLAEIPAVVPYVGKLRLVRYGEGILAMAALTTTVRLTCGRCLNSFEQALQIEFTERFRPSVDLATGNPTEKLDDDDIFGIDEYHTLDITEAVRQYALVSLPLSPVCRADCAGLCPVCGRDRNASQCGCESAPVDPRLAVLGQLLSDGERS